MDDLSARQLRAAVALARHRSYIAAAAFLGISQPTLTRTIQGLERLLGVTLFQRGRMGVAATPAGREFTLSAERWLADLDLQVKGMRELAEQRRGTLVIATLMSIAHRLLPRAIVAYRRRSPSIAIHVRAGLQDAVHADVSGGIAELGIGTVIGVAPPLVAEVLAEEACHLLLPRSHRLARKARVSIGDLAGEPMVSMPLEAALRRQIDAAAAQAGVALSHTVTLNQFDAQLDLVAAGVGLAIVPATALPDRSERRVVARPLTRPPIRRRLAWLRRHDRPLSPAAEGFLQALKPLLR
jgi:LysR family transcriptional regulator, carnitine catabolism transcriptional activator